MIHCLASRTAGNAPLQVDVSANPPSAYLIKIVYAVIGVPFSIGFVHEILT